MDERKVEEWFNNEKKALDLKKEEREAQKRSDLAEALETIDHVPSAKLRDYISKNFSDQLKNNFEVMKAAVLKDGMCFWEAPKALRNRPVLNIYHDLARACEASVAAWAWVGLGLKNPDDMISFRWRDSVDKSMKYIKDPESLNEFKTIFYEVYQTKLEQAKNEIGDAESAVAFNRIKEYVFSSEKFNSIQPAKTQEQPEQEQPKDAAEKQGQPKEAAEKQKPKKHLRDRIMGRK